MDITSILYYFSFHNDFHIICLFLYLSLLVGVGLMKQIVKQTGKIILTDSYQENIMELMPGLRHMGIQNMLENSLRAETGDVSIAHLVLEKNGRI